MHLLLHYFIRRNYLKSLLNYFIRRNYFKYLLLKTLNNIYTFIQLRSTYYTFLINITYNLIKF
uniref:Putative ovule protein n=1 Tax=Solanum chacoense TaxID=4108 RepID=A0A0V0HMR7_SOLCH